MIGYSLAVGLMPINPDGYFLRGQAFYSLDRNVEAIDDFTRSLVLHPRQKEAIHWRGHAYHDNKQFQKAEEDFTRALALRSDDAHLLYCRGLSRLSLLKIDEALVDLRRSLALNASQKEEIATTLNNYAWLMVTGSARHPAPARRLIDEALQLMPEASIFLNTYGVVLYRQGKYSQAVIALEKSLQNSQGEHDGFDLYFLAMCHACLNDQHKAQDCLQRAIAWHEKQQAKLSGTHQKELNAFRAEATEVVNRK